MDTVEDSNGEEEEEEEDEASEREVADETGARSSTSSRNNSEEAPSTDEATRERRIMTEMHAHVRKRRTHRDTRVEGHGEHALELVALCAMQQCNVPTTGEGMNESYYSYVRLPSTDWRGRGMTEAIAPLARTVLALALSRSLLVSIRVGCGRR
jgi:hypothetical protein